MSLGSNLTTYPGLDGTPARPRFAVYERAKDFGVYNSQGTLVAVFPLNNNSRATALQRANILAELLHHSGVRA